MFKLSLIKSETTITTLDKRSLNLITLNPCRRHRHFNRDDHVSHNRRNITNVLLLVFIEARSRIWYLILSWSQPGSIYRLHTNQYTTQSQDQSPSQLVSPNEWYGLKVREEGLPFMYVRKPYKPKRTCSNTKRRVMVFFFYN